MVLILPKIMSYHYSSIQKCYQFEKACHFSLRLVVLSLTATLPSKKNCCWRCGSMGVRLLDHYNNFVLAIRNNLKVLILGDMSSSCHSSIFSSLNTKPFFILQSAHLAISFAYTERCFACMYILN